MPNTNFLMFTASVDHQAYETMLIDMYSMEWLFICLAKNADATITRYIHLDGTEEINAGFTSPEAMIAFRDQMEAADVVVDTEPDAWTVCMLIPNL
jgi:hypothetical protein